MKQTRLLPLILFACLLSPIFLQAQQTITADQRKEAVNDLAEALNTTYVFPEKGEAMKDLLLEKEKSGQYDHLTDAVALADQLTKDIRQLTNDLHLRVGYRPQRLQEATGQEGRDSDPDAEFWHRKDNYGFQEVKILPGNIGYIDLRQFAPPSVAGETAAACMNLLANTDAIIFDLRQNGGGSPGMIQLLTSYLYSAEDDIHLNSFYFRPEDITTQTWTLPFVPGARNSDAEVYVLTSRYTFSAAEEFTYNLKNLERATIIGETTGGGAHPGGMHPIGDRFAAFIPNGRAINPITETNWEGTGVSPHIEIESDKALLKAQAHALEALAQKAASPRIKDYYAWQQEVMESRLNPVEISQKEMEAITGLYGERKILLENGELLYQRGEGPKFALQTLSENSFILRDQPILKLTINKKGKEYWMTAAYDNGHIEESKRTTTKP
ncbi:MAG: S41 family peptidase [Bacteroidetes bacterium]|nr:S41 family peptidase [Bacteroidota bacterium]